MSIDELYEFCLKNNFAHFDSNEFGKELMVRMNGNFEKTSKDEDKHKESLTPFVSRAFHDHVNLNKSEISEESFNENVPSANFRPILAHITTNSDNELDFGSHDYYVTTDKDGNDKVVYEEQPIGVIDGTKTTIEYDEDAGVNRAVLHGYLYDEYCQDAIEILNRRGTVDCSVELCIRELSFNTANKTLQLDDFYVSGLTLLSKDVSPGMAGSNFKIEDFAVNAETVTFNTDNKLVETLEKLTNILESFDINQKSKEGGTNNKMTKFEELLAKYGKTAEDVTFDYTEMSDEELEAKFAEMFDDDNSEGDNSDNGESGEPSNDGDGDGEGASDPDGNEGESQTFEKIVRTYEISHEDTRYALYNLLAPYEESDNDYYYISNVFDSYFVYEGWCTDKIYRQNYTKDGDNVAFDGERIELFRELLTASEKAELESMRSNYAALKEFKETAEKNELHAQKKAIINADNYSVLTEKDSEGNYVNTDFAELVKTMDNYSVEDFETKVKVMHSDYMSAHANFSSVDTKKNTNSVKILTNMNKKSKPKKNYGNLFD
uniref:Uncharacterized protein n=1 Tax=Siphoviridae sp. ctEkS11 TaxID=2827272 RepID=A0A8S5R4K8_9CAUD|nr:MAG TPA: hypothetical protein [Siphoviridae sp. ctEkS11]